jgi:hypothetical protein
VPGTSPQAGGLSRSLSVWQAIGLSIALTAPRMAAGEGIAGPEPAVAGPPAGRPATDAGRDQVSGA